MRSVSKFIRQAQHAPTPHAAAHAWEKAWRAEPNNPEALLGYCDALLQIGRANDAIPLLEALILRARASSEAYALLGEAYMIVGEASRAAEQFRLALLLESDSAELHNNLSVALLAARRFEEATVAAGQAIALDADYKEAQVNLAAALQRLGRNEEAIVALQRAAELAPNELDVMERLGTALRVAERFEAAQKVFQACVRLAPRQAMTHYHLAMSYWDACRWKEARPCFQRAVDLEPTFTDAHAKLAGTCVHLRQYPEAIACYEKVLALAPRHDDALCFLPYCYMNMGRIEEAKPLIENALALAANRGLAENLEGIYFQWKAQIEEAIARGRRVLRDHPLRSDTHHNLSLWLLSLGQYEEGFAENEWRLPDRVVPVSIAHAPYWDGKPMPDRILVAAQEQGIGDTIMFARYLPLVKARVGRLKVMCLESVAPVIASIPGIDELIPYRDDDPPALTLCDARVSLPSLPFLFKTTLATIPKAPYVSANPARSILWRERMAKDGPELKIGLVWAGNPEFMADAIRSPGIEALAPLTEVPGVRFYSFQKGAGREQLSRCPKGLEMVDLGPELTDFAETAAALQGMDLLISSCTSIVHLAGALGVQTWVALCYSPDWRWMWNRADSPWYPSLRLFRQPNMGDWRTVYRRMAQELTRYALFAQENSRSPDATRHHGPEARSFGPCGT